MRWNERLYIKDLVDKIGETHTLYGWVQFTRKSGKIRFLGFRDGSSIMQGVLVRGETDDTTYDMFKELRQETSIKMTGVVQESKQSQYKSKCWSKRLTFWEHLNNTPLLLKITGSIFCCPIDISGYDQKSK
jgi:aspartyl/asparaginyl-tRNA synthetase